MRQLINAKPAGNILLVSLGLLLVFHILALFGIVPLNVTWGGQATSTNRITLEVIALVVTLLFGSVVAAKVGYIQVSRFAVAVHILLWIVFLFLILNTFGNLTSGVSVERFIFAPITIVLALCALRLAIDK